LEFPEGKGFFCIQILILPKGKPTEGLAVDRFDLEKFLLCPTSLENMIFNTNKVEIETSAKSDFSVCVITFRVPHEFKMPFGFIMAPDRPLTATQIKALGNSDKK
jgi:hypothetical protein